MLGGVPSYIARLFATTARARSQIAAVLPTEQLPSVGLELSAPRFTSGVGVAPQTENSAVQETDPATDRAVATVGYIAGNVDLSRQLFDRSSLTSFDRALAVELAAALATSLDDQLLHGSGTAPQLRGLANVSGITAVTKTNATPSAATNLAAIGDLVAETATAYGAQPTHLLMAPRRFEFIVTKLGYAPQWPVDNVVLSAAISTTLGAGTNQDEIYAIVAEELWLFRDSPAITVFPEIGSGALTVRVQARQAAGLLGNRIPQAIGRLTGSELAAPVF
jgi:hypothetical protein